MSPAGPHKILHPSRSAWIRIGLGAAAAGASAIAFLAIDAPSPAPSMAPALIQESLPKPLTVAPSQEAASEPSLPAFTSVEAHPAPTADPSPAPDPLPALEQNYRAARSKEAQLDLIPAITGSNNAEAIETLSRLFAVEKHPDLKAALIGGLGDIEPNIAPEARLRLARAALGPEARPVRRAALAVLAGLDDPQSLELLRQAKTADPDLEIRSMASALYQARLADDQP